MARILISDKMSELALETFQSWGLDVDYEPGLSPEELRARIDAITAALAGRTITEHDKIEARIRPWAVGERQEAAR